jgi:hypothetical protein
MHRRDQSLLPAMGHCSIARNLLLDPALALCPPQLHHICLGAYGVGWWITAVSALQKPLEELLTMACFYPSQKD